VNAEDKCIDLLRHNIQRQEENIGRTLYGDGSERLLIQGTQKILTVAQTMKGYRQLNHHGIAYRYKLMKFGASLLNACRPGAKLNSHRAVSDFCMECEECVCDGTRARTRTSAA
jgi:hypothetical protein